MRDFIFAVVFGAACLAINTAAWANKAEGGGEAGQQYVKLESVLVNLEGKRHYLRADIQLMVADGHTAEAIKANMPAVQHALIMLFSGRNPELVATVDEREKLRKNAKAEIAKLLAQYHADKGFEDVFFTDFLVQ